MSFRVSPSQFSFLDESSFVGINCDADAVNCTSGWIMVAGNGNYIDNGTLRPNHFNCLLLLQCPSCE